MNPHNPEDIKNLLLLSTVMFSESLVQSGRSKSGRFKERKPDSSISSSAFIDRLFWT